MNHEREYGSNVVRAWMDTVLLPILGRIELDVRLLAAGNWTWQYYPGDFEYLRPVSEYVEGPARLNLRQMLEAKEEISTHFENRDRTLQTLLCECGVESQKYRDSDVLQKIISTRLEESQGDLGPRVANGWEGNTQFHDRDYIIEYLVNNREDLPPYYVLSRFWSAHREELFSLIAQEPDLRDAKERTRKAGESLRHLELELGEYLWQQVKGWSLSYDLPIMSSTN